MAYEQREGEGALFRNDKRGNEKAPDYRGTCTLHGAKFEIAGRWKREGTNGKPAWMALKVQPARDRT